VKKLMMYLTSNIENLEDGIGGRLQLKVIQDDSRERFGGAELA
jgi:hypothetical protein